MIGDIMQPTHLLFVLVIALLVLGPKRLPEVGRQLGRGLRDFRAAINGDHTEQPEKIEVDHGYVSEVHQSPPQPVEHQFGHETADSAMGSNHVATEPVTNGHQFGDNGAEPVADGGRFADEAPAPAPGQETGPGTAGGQTDAGAADHQTGTGTSGTAGEPEFAYEPARPADKPADPLT
jgi:sec-independent protein translocase protein TatA